MTYRTYCYCLMCANAMANIVPSGNQPSGGTEFTTRGHYGSNVSDFMDGTMLAINICDACLIKAKDAGLVLRCAPIEIPVPELEYKIW
jgi:hypothetical protein